METITITDALWLLLEGEPPAYGDGLITVRDDTGGNALVAIDEIPTLIVALQRIYDVSREGDKS